MAEIISYKMCAVKVRNAKLRNYLNHFFIQPAPVPYLLGEISTTQHKIT